jgi:hypothetical protein
MVSLFEHNGVDVRRRVSSTFLRWSGAAPSEGGPLALKLVEEYEKHPIAVHAIMAYSPASIGKAYVRAMGIPPIFDANRLSPKPISAPMGRTEAGHVVA